MKQGNVNQAGVTILVVEDDASIRDILSLALTADGYKVITAANGQEALKILSEMSNPCLILLDLMMPIMNGWQFAAAISENANFKNIPIVVLTAFADKVKTIPGKLTLKKPIDLELLFEVAKKYCHEAN